VRSTTASLDLSITKPGLTGLITATNSPLHPGIDSLVDADRYVNAAKATIPREAEQVEFKGANNRIYRINQWKTNTFEFQYMLHGRPTRRQVTYIDVDLEHQVCLIVVADAESAQPVLGMAKVFINSWFWGDGLN
jgi:hypothetical protein